MEDSPKAKVGRPRKHPENFWDNVKKTENGCWDWTGHSSCGRGKKPYGRHWDGKKLLAVHRHSYELAKGPIPPGLEIDHLCRNTLCVRPEHLEAVTSKENVLRGKTIAARNASATHCPLGHPYDEKNTRFATQTSGRVQRVCRECESQKQAARYWRKRNAPTVWE
jgi:hypothetical protein